MSDVIYPIRYWIADGNEYPVFYESEGKTVGIYAELLERLTENTGRHTEYIGEYDGDAITAATAMDMLKSGELDMVLGLAGGLPATEEYRPSCELYRNTLTAVILRESPQIPAENAGNCYWAADTSVMRLLDGTALEGHTVDYKSGSDMVAALENHDVYGMLVKRSSLDYEALAGRNFKYREYEGLKIPYSECAYMRCADDALCDEIDEICEELAGEYAAEATDSLAIYTNLLADARREGGITAILAGGGIALCAVLAVTVAVMKNRLGRIKKLDEARFKTLFSGEPDKELFELDLRKKTITAYNGFRIFGVTEGSIPDCVTLEKLSALMGFDFVTHYSGISECGNTIYRNRFVIHAGGNKLYITEEGRRTGHIVMITLTNIRN